LILLAISIPRSIAASDLPSPLYPSDAAARRNAFRIFNAVHSALRQWGSSIHHNGLSALLATVPRGQLLYHGSRSPHANRGMDGEGFDWLAFELEHAQCFAQSWEPGDGSGGEDGDAQRDDCATFLGYPPADGLVDGAQDTPAALGRRRGRRPHGGQRVIASGDADADDIDYPPYPVRGYLHTYRAARPLRLLYLDGMAASKSPLGTLDLQDLVLLGRDADDADLGSDGRRARGLCGLLDRWAAPLDGFVRMEAGFEVLLCRFGPGGPLDLVGVRGSPFANESAADARERRERPFSEWLRAAAGRYAGLPAGRAVVDWGSVVSLFAYDVNVTNPDASRADLPRAVGLSDAERRAVRDRVREVATERLGEGDERKRHSAVDWQGIADLIVARYSDRLEILANASTKTAGSLVEVMTDPYVDYTEGASTDQHLITRCSLHYLEPAILDREAWTREDRSIYIALEEVSREICALFFRLRILLRGETATMNVEQVAETVREETAGLMAKLSWSVWRECRGCRIPDETCLVAMFPWGEEEDHFSPKCRGSAGLETFGSYWAPERRHLG